MAQRLNVLPAVVAVAEGYAYEITLRQGKACDIERHSEGWSVHFTEGFTGSKHPVKGQFYTLEAATEWATGDGWVIFLQAAREYRERTGDTRHRSVRGGRAHQGVRRIN